jgi:hypothetical protein
MPNAAYEIKINATQTDICLECFCFYYEERFSRIKHFHNKLKSDRRAQK